jgi:hypothetical protein
MSGGGPRTAHRRIDPAAWGDDHVGRALPNYATGDECLFCHRKIGPTWGDNPHQLTVRPAEPDDPAVGLLRQLAGDDALADQTLFLLGSGHITRYLRRSEAYGRLDMLSTALIPAPHEEHREGEGVVHPTAARLIDTDSPQWDTTTFANRCAGCHATAVDAKSRAFSSPSLGCFTCHGSVSLEHTKDPSRVLLSKSNRDAKQVISLCGQCHLRGGKSATSGLPYPNTFVAGDNLFRDFKVDLSDAAIKTLPAIGQHIYRNARDVAAFGQNTMTCITCHNVHGHSSRKHRHLNDTATCSLCHVPGTDHVELRDQMLAINRLRTGNRVCGYGPRETQHEWSFRVLCGSRLRCPAGRACSGAAGAWRFASTDRLRRTDMSWVASPPGNAGMTPATIPTTRNGRCFRDGRAALAM